MKTTSMAPTSVLTLLQSKLERFKLRTALCIKKGSEWQELTYAELGQQAYNFANYLLELGIQRGDRIAILCESRPEWSIYFFAGILAGAIVVPLDTKLSENELSIIIADCAPRVLFTSTSYQSVARNLKSHDSSVEKVFVLEEDKLEFSSTSQLNFPDLSLLRESPQDEVAAIIYTSGTTGDPKGVMITLSNLIFEAEALRQVVGISPDDNFLSILPLNHLLELTGGLLTVLCAGGTICYSHSLYPQDIVHILQERKITAIIGVPLFFKTLQNSIQKQVLQSNQIKRLWFQAATFLARGIPWQMGRRILFFPLHQKFGGKLRILFSGGAPLDTDVARFFERLGLPILQGYGLTETSPVSCVNTLQANRIGSVGKALPGVEIKIDFKEHEQTEGEILIRGPHVMKGYYHKEELTREVLEQEGWFHTGDLGFIDSEGFLYVTGRIKNLIVLGGSKKVSPEEVEAVLSKSSSLQEVCVVGRVSKHGITRGTEEVCAVAVPSESLKQRMQGQPNALTAEIEKEIEHLAINLTPYKRPSRIFVHVDGLPKTSTRKVKRSYVLQWLSHQE